MSKLTLIVPRSKTIMFFTLCAFALVLYVPFVLASVSLPVTQVEFYSPYLMYFRFVFKLVMDVTLGQEKSAIFLHQLDAVYRDEERRALGLLKQGVTSNMSFWETLKIVKSIEVACGIQSSGLHEQMASELFYFMTDLLDEGSKPASKRLLKTLLSDYERFKTAHVNSQAVDYLNTLETSKDIIDIIQAAMKRRSDVYARAMVTSVLMMVGDKTTMVLPSDIVHICRDRVGETMAGMWRLIPLLFDLGVELSGLEFVFNHCAQELRIATWFTKQWLFKHQLASKSGHLIRGSEEAGFVKLHPPNPNLISCLNDDSLPMIPLQLFHILTHKVTVYETGLKINFLNVMFDLRSIIEEYPMDYVVNPKKCCIRQLIGIQKLEFMNETLQQGKESIQARLFMSNTFSAFNASLHAVKLIMAGNLVAYPTTSSQDDPQKSYLEAYRGLKKAAGQEIHDNLLTVLASRQLRLQFIFNKFA